MTGRIKIERRIEKRTYLKYASSFTILSEGGLLPFDLIDLVDISKDGLSFMLAKDFGVYEEGNEINARIYLNGFRNNNYKYYLPVLIKVINSAEFIDKDGYKMRYGCNIEYSDPAIVKVIKDFIKFIESAAQHLKEDKGDYFISNTVA